MSVFSKILKNLGKSISKELERNASKNASKEATKETSKNAIKGDNFTMQKDSTPPSPQIKIQTDMQPNLKKSININQDKPLSADIAWLKDKHPEMFGSYGKAYQTLLSIKNAPKWSLKNNRDDIAMIAKDLPQGKIGKMGIKRDTNEVRHLTKRNSRSSDEVKKKPLEVESPTLSTPSQMQGKAGANSTFSKGKPNSTKNAIQKQDSSKLDSTLESTTLIDNKLPPMMRE